MILAGLGEKRVEDLRGGQQDHTAQSTAIIAGFWRRIFALFLDMLLLALVGLIIGTFAFRQVVALGQEGRLIGATITLAYFGILNSAGGTLGKRVLGLWVIRRNGESIGIVRSLLRTVIFWAPYYLNGIYFEHLRIPGMPVNPKIDAAAGVADVAIVFGGFTLIFYFYVFNRRTRQSLHDLLAGTFVVRRLVTEAPVREKIWKWHFVFAGAALAISVVACVTMLWTVPNTIPKFQDLTAIQAAVANRPNVDRVGVQLNTSMAWTSGSGTTTQTSLIVTARLKAVPETYAAVEDDIANRVLQLQPSILGQQYLRVTISYGYDLGIFSWTNSDSWVGTPEQWQTRIGKITT